MTVLTWVLIVFIGFQFANVIYTIEKIGAPRKPYTNTDAVSSFIVCGLYVWAYIALLRAIR